MANIRRPITPLPVCDDVPPWNALAKERKEAGMTWIDRVEIALSKHQSGDITEAQLAFYIAKEVMEPETPFKFFKVPEKRKDSEDATQKDR